MIDIRTVDVDRYVMPFKEGGSLPGLVDADDNFSYVLKFIGAGQGTRALIADFIGMELARLIGLNVPELVFANVDVAFGQSEPDEEIQDLLKASVGKNLGVSYLQKAIAFDPVVTFVKPEIANIIVWLDAFLLNVDRTVKNTNMLVWQKDVWMIDYGACLYFHHNISSWKDMVASPFKHIKSHVLVYNTKNINQTVEELLPILTLENITNIVSAIPDEWLLKATEELSPMEQRDIYIQFLIQRLKHHETFTNELRQYER